MSVELMDTIMVECAQCCKKHLSAALAYFAECARESPPSNWDDAEANVCLGRAFINMVEANEGYASHTDLARGFLVMAEDCAGRDPLLQQSIRRFRLEQFDAGLPRFVFPFRLSSAAMYAAHLREAEREYPEIRTAVDASQFRGGKSIQDQNQNETLYMRAMIKWLDENIFLKEEGKGEEKMATKAKKACGKGGCAAKAKKAAAKGGCAAKGGKKGKK